MGFEKGSLMDIGFKLARGKSANEYYKHETLTFTINNKKVKAIHKGTKLFKEQKNGLNELKAFIRDEIKVRVLYLIIILKVLLIGKS